MSFYLSVSSIVTKNWQKITANDSANYFVFYCNKEALVFYSLKIIKWNSKDIWGLVILLYPPNRYTGIFNAAILLGNLVIQLESQLIITQILSLFLQCGVGQSLAVPTKNKKSNHSQHIWINLTLLVMVFEKKEIKFTFILIADWRHIIKQWMFKSKVREVFGYETRG